MSDPDPSFERGLCAGEAGAVQAERLCALCRAAALRSDCVGIGLVGGE